MDNLQLDERDYFQPKYSWQPEGKSKFEQIKSLSKKKRKEYLSKFTKTELELLNSYWPFFARPKQLPPPLNIVDHPLGWKYWIFLAGRGSGKTRTAAEYVRYRIEKGLSKRIALIGPTYRDVLKVMLKGESGLLNVFAENSEIKAKFVKQENTVYFKKKDKIIAEAYIYTGEEPERLRGPQHDFAWFDELAAFKYLEEIWLLFVAGHRLGDNPQAIFTTTPKANLLKIDLLKSDRAVVTFGTTFENKDNLAPGTVEILESLYQDTDFAEQELKGKLRLDESGALFKQGWINKYRIVGGKIQLINNIVTIKTNDKEIQLRKVYVTVDPSGSAKDSACECGIVLVGLGTDNKCYVLEDLSKRCTPDEWATISVLAAQKYSGEVVYETNFGGEIVGTLVKKIAKELGLTIKCTGVGAQKNKYERAIPISPAVQKGNVVFVGYHQKLEHQMTTWLPGDKSPDRMDAFVWGATQCILNQPVRGNVTNILSF